MKPFSRDNLGRTMPAQPGRRRSTGNCTLFRSGNARGPRLGKIAILNEQTDENGNNRASPIAWTMRLDCARAPGAYARNFRFRTSKLMQAGIIVRSQELECSLSAGRASRFAAEHTPGF
jgi:hypothetical protein